MKMPSLNTLFQSSASTLRRFPSVLLSAFVGTALWLWYSEVNYQEYEANRWLLKSTVLAFLGISLQFAIAIFAEGKGWSRVLKTVAAAMGFALLAVLYFAFDMREIDMVRFALYGLAFHLLASFSGFLKSEEKNGFWQFNKSLFLRSLASALYSGVLYAGLAIAIAAIENLFGIEFIGKIYLKLFIAIAGVFSTWFFLSGVPENLAELEHSHEYPKALKIFTQYVLLPLVTVYLVILYAYVLKIIIEQEWPQGWVATLVLAFSIAGILSLLLVWPIRNTEGNTWISTFSKWFYRALLPLSVLLGLAIWRRVSEYGITEERYFVIALAVWLLGITLYFIISKKQNIKVIPITLFLGAVAISFGPWGAFEVSKRSQIGRLENILVKNGVLKEGKIDSTATDISGKDAQQVRAVITYLATIHGTEIVYNWLKDKLDAEVLKSKLPTVTENLQKRAGRGWWLGLNQENEIYKVLKAESTVNTQDHYYPNDPISFQADLLSVNSSDYIPEQTVEGYTIVCTYLAYSFGHPTKSENISEYALNGAKITISQKEYVPELVIRYKGSEMIVDLRKTALFLKENRDFLPEDIQDGKNVIVVENNVFKVKVVLLNFEGICYPDKITVHRIAANIFIGRK